MTALEILSRQKFDTFRSWVNHATSSLTSHENYHPQNFRAVCFDRLGRRCWIGADFMRARDEGAFPVYWLWPDQIGKIALLAAGEA